MKWRRTTIVIGGERAMTEKKQRTTTHDVKEQRNTKTQGPSLMKRKSQEEDSQTQESKREEVRRIFH
jgi:hypothetical protein